MNTDLDKHQHEILTRTAKLIDESDKSNYRDFMPIALSPSVTLSKIW